MSAFFWYPDPIVYFGPPPTKEERARVEEFFKQFRELAKKYPFKIVIQPHKKRVPHVEG